MSCTIPDKRSKAVQRAVEAFIGNAKSFREVKPGVIEMPITKTFPRNRLYAIALKNADRVTRSMKDQYGDKFSYGWVSIDTTLNDTIIARIMVPNELVQAWNVQLGHKSLEEINSDPHLFSRDISYFQGDEALMEQEYINDEEFYKEFDETFSNFSLKDRYQYDRLRGEYDGSSDWKHDSSNDKDVHISDAELERIKRQKNIC